MKTLFIRGADLYVEAQNGWNVMHHAAHGQALEAVKELFTQIDKTSKLTKQQGKRALPDYADP